MRKNGTQSFTVIRKNGKRYMTEVSNKKLFARLLDMLVEVAAFWKSFVRDLPLFKRGVGGKHYVALSSNRLRGGMQMGRR